MDVLFSFCETLAGSVQHGPSEQADLLAGGLAAVPSGR